MDKTINSSSSDEKAKDPEKEAVGHLALPQKKAVVTPSGALYGTQDEP